MTLRPSIIGFLAAVFALALDQATKAAVLAHFADPETPELILAPFLDIVLVANHGVSFGLFNTGAGWRPLVFSLLTVVIVGGLVYALCKTALRWNALGMGLIIGGAIGNLIDRLRFGSVVDFVDFFIGNWHWYVFNLADAAICIGVGVLLLDSLLSRPESPKA